MIVVGERPGSQGNGQMDSRVGLAKASLPLLTSSAPPPPNFCPTKLKMPDASRSGTQAIAERKLTKQSFQIDEATAERDALVLPSKSRGAEIRLSELGLKRGSPTPAVGNFTYCVFWAYV